MSLLYTLMMTLLSSSMVIAFVLHPSGEDVKPASTSGCQDESLESIKKSLLKELNLQREPQLPAGELDGIREQWQRTFSAAISQSVLDTTAPVLPGSAESSDTQNSASPKCCPVVSEVFMKDLGWDNWVIHPKSLTIVRCGLCNSLDNTVQCSSPHESAQNTGSQEQMPCCKPKTQEMVPIVFMDETSTISIYSVQLTRSCGCKPDNAQQIGQK